MLRPVLEVAIALSGAGYLLALKLGSRMARYLLKPGTMLLIIGLALAGYAPGNAGSGLLVVGLACSLVGDVLLMLPNDRFQAGLAAFLVAHLCYIGAFSRRATPTAADAVVFLLLGVWAVLAYRRFRPNLVGALPYAVGLYMAVMVVMAGRALLTGRSVVAMGAVLFVISDSLLGWNRFARRMPWSEYAIMTTYFAAQFCFALSLAAS